MPLDSTQGLTGRPPSDVTTIIDDSPLGIARSNFHTVQGRLIAAESAYERLHDMPFSDQERDQHEAEIAGLQERLTQRLAELNAIETEQGLPLAAENDGADDRAPRLARLAFLRDQRQRRASPAERGS